MTKPRVRQRRSFGGKQGIWWRNKVLNPPSSIDIDSPPSQGTNDEPTKPKSTTVEEKVEIIGWDDELCRPIYHQRNNVVSDGCHDELSEDDVNIVGESTEESQEPEPVPKVLAPIAPVKRMRTFGGRSRRPLSLVLFESNLDYTSTSPASSPDKKRSRVDVSSSSPESIPLSTKEVVGGSMLPSRVSTSPTDPLSDEETKVAENNTASSSPGNSNGTPKLSPFDFIEAEAGKPNETSLKDQEHITANSSLLKAKEYFEHLDATEKLKLDSTDSPVVSSRVIRTSRKISLASPGITQEYAVYAKASAESGVSPLPLKDFARSRRDFFRKAELFDGFLDD